MMILTVISFPTSFGDGTNLQVYLCVFDSPKTSLLPSVQTSTSYELSIHVIQAVSLENCTNIGKLALK